MLPETFPSNWRFGLGFFDKSSLIYGMSRQATLIICVASSLQWPSFHGGECSSEFLHGKEKIVYFFRCTIFLANKIASSQLA